MKTIIHYTEIPAESVESFIFVVDGDFSYLNGLIINAAYEEDSTEERHVEVLHDLLFNEEGAYKLTLYEASKLPNLFQQYPDIKLIFTGFYC